MNWYTVKSIITDITLASFHIDEYTYAGIHTYTGVQNF